MVWRSDAADEREAQAIEGEVLEVLAEDVSYCGLERSIKERPYRPFVVEGGRDRASANETPGHEAAHHVVFGHVVDSLCTRELGEGNLEVLSKWIGDACVDE